MLYYTGVDLYFMFVAFRIFQSAIFVFLQLQEKYIAVNKRLYMAFVAFVGVPQKVIWLALRKLGVEEWIRS